MSILAQARATKKPLRIPAIILAGGLGTRLRSIVSDIPKSMAPVNGPPFLNYVFRCLQQEGITEVILAIGYKGEAIREFFGDKYAGIKIQYSVEEEPLGTGGAIKKAFDLVDDFAFVLNGDTLFDINLEELKDFYFENDCDLVVALKHLHDFDRYGAVLLDENNRIRRFDEKKWVSEGMINGGVYFFSKDLFEKLPSEEKFSFERDILEKYTDELQFYGKVFNGYFIDIGIPEDYEKAQHDFK